MVAVEGSQADVVDSAEVVEDAEVAVELAVEDGVAVEDVEQVLTITDKVHKVAQTIYTVHIIKEDNYAVNKTHVSGQEFREDLLTTR